MKQNESIYKDNGEPRHIRNYPVAGILVFSALLVVGLIATIFIFVFDTMSTNPQLNAAFFGLVFVCGVLAIGLLYVLFTLRNMLRLVREQASHLLVLRAGRSAAASTSTSVTYAPSTSPPVEYQTTSRDVILIEGIGPVYSGRLSRKGIKTLRDLRAQDAATVAAAADAPIAAAIQWKTMADLLVVPEIDHQAAEILTLAGIESVDDLAAQEAGALSPRVVQVNRQHENRIVPNEIPKTMVQEWIRGAKALSGPRGGAGERRRASPRGPTA